MKILRIMFKEIIVNIRDFKANIMMVLFPIVLIIILGAAFSGVFKDTIQLGDIEVRYTIDSKYDNTSFTTALSVFFESLSEETGISFEKTDDFEKGMADIENNLCAAYIHITGDPLRADMYKNEKRGFSSGIVENALDSFLGTYAAIDVIARNNPSALSMQANSREEDHVQVRALDKKRQPGSTDYYAVTMLTLILLYASQTGFWSIRNEIEQKTASRMLCAPVRKYQLLTGKVLGCIFITVIQGLGVLLFSPLVLKANWGNDLFTVALLIISYSIMTVSLGAALAYFLKTSEAANGILNTAIPIMVFLGGGYVPLSVMGAAISKISVISPVRWINSALMRLIYDGSYGGVVQSIAINLGLAALFIIIAAVFSRRGDRAYA